MNYQELYKVWCENVKDPEMKADLESIRENDAEISDRFYRDLEFGTAGLRGVLGAGTNRMNIYTVGRATQALCVYLKEQEAEPSVAIAYDSRIKSDVFSNLAAGIFAANGIRAYLYPQLMPTPCLSYAVRYLKCTGGINITASHNPSKYNGYKVYGADGCQITEVAANRILALIGETDTFRDVKVLPLDQALASGLVTYIGEDTVRTYLDLIAKESLLPKDVSRELKIVYTPLNGAGISVVPRCLKEHGFTNITIPAEQEHPDGNFPTCPYPNPEIREALDVALNCAEKIGAEFVIATDPDCDRCGAAVRKDGKIVLITGNQMGCLLLDFICRMKKDSMPEKPVAVKTIVTTELAARVAAYYGVELRNVLTGFKYIGEQIHNLESEGHAERFLLGYEESYGYLTTPGVRDKDAVNASLLICEMAAWYKSQNLTLLDGLDELYKKFGYFTEKVISLQFEGESGFHTMMGIMDYLRANKPEAMEGRRVMKAVDYKLDETGLPKSNVLQYTLEGGTVVTARPSGTEPKLKFYFSACGASKEDSETIVKELEAYCRKIVAEHS